MEDFFESFVIFAILADRAYIVSPYVLPSAKRDIICPQISTVRCYNQSRIDPNHLIDDFLVVRYTVFITVQVFSKYVRGMQHFIIRCRSSRIDMHAENLYMFGKRR